MDPQEFQSLISNFPVKLPNDYIDKAWTILNNEEVKESDNTSNAGSLSSSTIQEDESRKASILNDQKEFYSYLRCFLSNTCGEQEGSELCASFYSTLENRLRVANLEDFDKLASFVSECYYSL